MAMERFSMEEEPAKNYLKCSVWDSWGLSIITWAWKWSHNFLNPVGPMSRLRATMALENQLIQGCHWSGKNEGCKMSGEVMEFCWWPGKMTYVIHVVWWILLWGFRPEMWEPLLITSLSPLAYYCQILEWIGIQFRLDGTEWLEYTGICAWREVLMDVVGWREWRGRYSFTFNDCMSLSQGFQIYLNI